MVLVSNPTIHETVIKHLLRLASVVTLCAFGAIFMPTPWMSWTHEQLGMGDFPASPLVEYLTRSVAGLYGFHGVLLMLVSTDVRRYRPIVIFLGLMNVVFGLIVLGIDLYAKLPLFWTLSEGPPVIFLGGLLLHLVRGVPRTG